MTLLLNKKKILHSTQCSTMIFMTEHAIAFNRGMNERINVKKKKIRKTIFMRFFLHYYAIPIIRSVKLYYVKIVVCGLEEEKKNVKENRIKLWPLIKKELQVCMHFFFVKFTPKRIIYFILTTEKNYDFFITVIT